VGVVREAIATPLSAERAYRLWIDVRRWPTFVDGFKHAERVDEGWPGEGAKLVWRSTPDGRGTVTERVIEAVDGRRLVTDVFEERLSGTQTVSFEPDEDGSVVEIELDYELAKGGPLRGVTDVLFIRRAQSDALVRTLRRFATEAAEEAAL
jgi:uncharacterized membrane protein